MKRYLFVTMEGGGNVPPVLGLAERLARRGHTVHVLTEPCLRDDVERRGAHFIAFQRYFDRESTETELFRDWEGRTPAGAAKRSFQNVIFGPAGIVAEETKRVLEAETFDVVVVDALMPGALIAAEAAGIPRVSLFHMPEYLPGPGRPPNGPFLPRTDLIGRLRDGLMMKMFYGLLRDFVPGINAVRRAFGLRSYGSPAEMLDLMHSADRRLIQTTSDFDFPMPSPPANVRYVGPILDDPHGAEPWRNPWAEEDERPLVVASLSTTFQNQQQTLQRVIDALGLLRVRGLVTLGPAMREEAFDVPDNVRVERFASHAQIFPHASALITHAGHGTLMRALVNGVPVVCLPMGRDQDSNAARVFYREVGLRLKPSASAASIAAMVKRVLNEPKFAGNAQQLGRKIAADAAEERAVRELEQLAGERIGAVA